MRRGLRELLRARGSRRRAPAGRPPGGRSLAGRPLTGGKVLAICLAFFGVIFTVNGYMMFRAIGGFPGLVEEHPYLVSQRYDIERTAQVALGWQVSLGWADGRVEAMIADRAGAPLSGLAVTAVLGRSVTRDQDRKLALSERPGAAGVYGAAAPLAPGRWRVEMRAIDAGGASFRAETTVYSPASGVAPAPASGVSPAPASGGIRTD